MLPPPNLWSSYVGGLLGSSGGPGMYHNFYPLQWPGLLPLPQLSDNRLGLYQCTAPAQAMAGTRYSASKDTSGNIKVSLAEQHQWRSFHENDTEMIVTRSGRRMFPIIKIQLEGLSEYKQYWVSLMMVPVDESRYRFTRRQWTMAGRAETHSIHHAVYTHYDTPLSGAQLMKDKTISFDKVKLTNNSKNPFGNVLLNSMHKYQPVIRILEASNGIVGSEHIFYFIETQFYAVTAYQNEKMTLMKIQKNPFAKGFRDRARSSSYRKRKSSFHDQLKEENEKRKSQEDEDEREGPPLSKRTLLSSHPTNSESPEQYRFIDHMTQLSNFHLAAQNFSQLSHGWRENSYFTQQFHNLQERSTPVTARAGRLF